MQHKTPKILFATATAFAFVKYINSMSFQKHMCFMYGNIILLKSMLYYRLKKKNSFDDFLKDEWNQDYKLKKNGRCYASWERMYNVVCRVL